MQLLGHGNPLHKAHDTVLVLILLSSRKVETLQGVMQQREGDFLLVHAQSIHDGDVVAPRHFLFTLTVRIVDWGRQI